MKIWLARHGETDWNARHLMQGTTDTQLNENGLAQAAALGRAMKDSGVSRVYTSHLQRAVRTGQIVAECLGVPCEAREGLQETGMGEWEGLMWSQIWERTPELTRCWMDHRRDTRPPGGESYQDTLDRFIPAVLRIVRENTQDVMIVSHNGSIKSFLAELNATPVQTMGEDYSVPNAGAIEIDAAMILKRFG